VDEVGDKNANAVAERPAAEQLSRDELLGVLVRYNEATERLRASHEALNREVGRLTAELEQKNRELERRERLALLGEMAAGVAHEIRNPLGGISLYTDILRQDLAAAGGQPAEIVGRIQGGIRILNRIVEDMLLFARDLRMDVQPQRLMDLVGGALELAGHEVSSSGLRVVLDETGLEAAVAADGSLVTRALVNLILNAAQAGQGRTEAALRITAGQTAEGWTRVVLEDSCGGIAAEDLAKIFNPFFTRREQGTGLGLAIVHRTIEAHGGRITAANNQVGGATFEFTLPQAEV
jgi:signal transduction histidine kinase